MGDETNGDGRRVRGVLAKSNERRVRGVLAKSDVQEARRRSPHSSRVALRRSYWFSAIAAPSGFLSQKNIPAAVICAASPKITSDPIQ